MKKATLFLLFCFSLVNADVNPAFFLGVRNNHYAFIGMELANRFGLSIENTVLPQGIEKQYVRNIVFYKWDLFSILHGEYSIFYGTRYDNDYYDVGARLDMCWLVHSRFFHLRGIIQPFYDSFYKYNTGYQLQMQTFPLQEIGLFGGIKNIPEYRDVERRFIGGLIINSGNIAVAPEISTPINNKPHLTRLTINFIYKSFI